MRKKSTSKQTTNKNVVIFLLLDHVEKIQILVKFLSRNKQLYNNFLYN